MKKCTKCKLEKELTEFRTDKKAKDGLQSWCYVCKADHERRYYLANKAKINANSKAYYQALKMITFDLELNPGEEITHNNIKIINTSTEKVKMTIKVKDNA